MSKEILKNKFKNGMYPDENDFGELIDYIDTQKNTAPLSSLQSDFSSSLMETNNYGKGTLDIVLGGSRSFTYTMPMSSKHSVTYRFVKNGRDDFIMLQDGYISTNEELLVTGEVKNYETELGDFNKDYPPNYYTTSVGDSIGFSFYGTGFDFNHNADERGGIWEFNIDDGDYIVEISTFSNPKDPSKNSRVVSDLPHGFHRVIATFKGNDPENPPSGGIARGWVSYDEGSGQNGAIRVLTSGSASTKKFDALYSTSNKEFAIQIKKVGNNDFNFVPMHNNVGTAFKIADQQLLIDDSPVTWTTGIQRAGISKLQLIQKFHGKLPETPENLVQITTVHTITDKGNVDFRTNIKVLEDIEIRLGYGIMTPVWNSFATNVLSGFGNSRDLGLADNSNEYYDESDKCKSYLFTSNNPGKENIGLAVRVNDPIRSFRIGGEGKFRPDRTTWMEHRNASMSKLYHGVFENYYAKKGEEFFFSGTYVIGELPHLNELF